MLLFSQLDKCRPFLFTEMGHRNMGWNALIREEIINLVVRHLDELFYNHVMWQKLQSDTSQRALNLFRCMFHNLFRIAHSKITNYGIVSLSYHRYFNKILNVELFTNLCDV